MILLLANIGNSDLEVNKNLLPTTEHMLSRELGTEVKSNYDKYQDSVRLPLLDPTIDWIIEHEDCDYDDLKLVLFVSNQNPELVSPANYQRDTYPVAEVIQLHLNEKHNMKKSATKIEIINGNPADYANALAFHQEKLRQLYEWYGDKAEKIYLEISGGTPAMTAMLLLVGVDIFEDKTTALYVDRNSDAAYEIPIAEALHARRTRANLLTQLDMYAYGVAYQTMQTQGHRITSDRNQQATIEGLLRYADRRLAFDYNRARTALRDVQTVGEAQQRIQHWQRELREPSAEHNIAELIYGAKIKTQQGEYTDFSQRLFRFQESMFRYMGEQMGIKYGKSSQYLRESWRTGQIELDDYLNSYQRDASGVMSDKNSPIQIQTKGRSLNRISLGAIVDYYLTQPDWSHWAEPAELIFGLSAVADLRNKGIAGHGFEGVGKQDIEGAYGAPLETLLTNLSHIFHQVFDKSLPTSPYHQINELVRQLIEDSV